MAILCKWEDLPEFMRTDEVRPYYDSLQKKKISLLFKRIFDITVSFSMLIVLFPVMLIIAIVVSLDSKGGFIYKQKRITRYGKEFWVLKYRTMVVGADKIGSQVTVKNDVRITKPGTFLRKLRLDEFPQLVNILRGEMSFVGTRPEVSKYVERYSPEMFATLLLPAGVTSNASIKYKDEDSLLENAENADEVYVNKVLPEKMKFNLESILNYNFFYEIGIMLRTVAAVLIKNKKAVIDVKDNNEVKV